MSVLIEARKKLIEQAMKEFERNNFEAGYAYIAGFYSSIILHLASDKLQDMEYVVNILKSKANLDLS